MTPSFALDFDAIARTLPDALCLISRDGDILSANPIARRLLRLDANDGAPVTLAKIFDGPQEKLTQFLTQCARTSEPVPGRFDLRTLDTTVTPCILSGHLIQPRTAESPSLIMLRIQTKLEFVRGFIVLNEKIRELEREIVHRTQAQQELQRHQEHLEELVDERTRELLVTNKELEAFCYSVSHDLRAPLRAIDGFSRILSEDHVASLDPGAHAVLERMRAAAQRMGIVIDELLELSRITRAALEIEDVDLTDLAHDTVARLQQSEPHRRVAVRIAEGLQARGDPALLSIALDNLLGNAWKYTVKVDEAKIEFFARREADDGVYVVRDNGAGFDMRFADKLFKPFERLHRVDEFPGTGIGLAIVQRVVHRHGGRVWADGAVNVGANFYFTLSAPPVAAVSYRDAAPDSIAE